MRFLLPFLCLMSFSVSAEVKVLPIFEFVGDSSESEFYQAYDRAFKRLSSFYAIHSWNTSVDLRRLIERVEVYASKEAFDKKLIQMSNGKMSSVPKTYVGVADKRILRVLAWPAYNKIHTKDSISDYEKLLTHEIAHQLHVDLLKGEESLMGPVWFYEGFAVLAANQYEKFEMNEREKMKAVILNSERGDYKSYGAVLRRLSKSMSLPALIEMAKQPEFSSKVVETLK